MKPALLITLVLAALAGSVGTAAARGSSGPPVIHERFTALPCAGTPKHRTTLQLEGCAERSVLSSDATIDGLAKTIYGKLGPTGRTDFSTASADWLSYRNAECAAAASPEGGGSEAPVVYAECLETEDTAHIAELRTFLQDSLPSLVG